MYIHIKTPKSQVTNFLKENFSQCKIRNNKQENPQNLQDQKSSGPYRTDYHK